MSKNSFYNYYTKRISPIAISVNQEGGNSRNDQRGKPNFYRKQILLSGSVRRWRAGYSEFLDQFPLFRRQHVIRFYPVYLITRTIIPVMYAESPDKDGPSKSGLGDIKSTIYFSPVEPIGGWFWGLGPGLIFPSATDSTLGSEKWSGGPTGALVRQDGGWTLVFLAGQAWSFAGNQSRTKLNTTFLQPQVSYTTKKETSFGVSSQSSYDWVSGEWTMPLEFSVSQLVKLGKQSVSLGVAWRTYVKRYEGGPNWGLGFTMAFLFPK